MYSIRAHKKLIDMTLLFYLACICAFCAIFLTSDILSIFSFCAAVLLFATTIHNAFYALSIPFLLLYLSECLLFLLILANNKQHKIQFSKKHFFITSTCSAILYKFQITNIHQIIKYTSQNIDIVIAISCFVITLIVLLVLVCISSVMVEQNQ